MPRVNRRNVIEAAFISALSLDAKNSDNELARLVAEHHRFDEEILAADDQADDLRSAERRAGRGRSAIVEADCARLEGLHARQGGVAHAIVTLPSASFVGVAHKLMLWRREAAIRSPDDFFDAHESFTFSAYEDVLRLTGLQRCAHACDPATRRRMKRFWL
jgi:hypothetical protein